MKKKFVVSVLLMTLLLMLACSISYDGYKLNDDPEPLEQMAGQLATEMIKDQPKP